MLGPTGVGVLYGREEVFATLPPYQGGGDMIESVTVNGSTWKGLPHRFEAGTPNIAGALGLHEAIKFLQAIDRPALLQKEKKLGHMALSGLREFPRVRTFVPEGDDWLGVLSFKHESIHSHDIAAVMDSAGVCMRAGHHCAQPLMDHLRVGSTSRISPYLYNTEEDINQFLEAIAKAEALFG